MLLWQVEPFLCSNLSYDDLSTSAQQFLPPVGSFFQDPPTPSSPSKESELSNDLYSIDLDSLEETAMYVALSAAMEDAENRKISPQDFKKLANQMFNVERNEFGTAMQKVEKELEKKSETKNQDDRDEEDGRTAVSNSSHIDSMSSAAWTALMKWANRRNLSLSRFNALSGNTFCASFRAN